MSLADKRYRRSVSGIKRSLIVLSAIILLGSVLVIAPGTVNAETRPGGTLKNDQPARVYTTGWWWSTIPDELQFKIPTKTNYYTAIAIHNRQSGEDFDLFAYDDYDMTQRIASSTLGSDEIDFVVIDGHTYTGNFKYANVIKFTGQDWTSGIRIESDYHSIAADLYGSDPDANGYLEIGERRYSMFEDHGQSTYTGTLRGELPLVNMHEVYLDAGGSYDFDIYSVPTQEQLSMYLFKGSGNSDDALMTDSATAGGGSLSFSYQPEVSGYYGLCVIDDNQGYSSTNNYTTLITSDFDLSASPTSRLIAPGMNASYMIDVESLGITKDIELHYRWQNAGGTNVTTPAGASASLNVGSVNIGGVGNKIAYLNVTTTSSMSAGNYFLKVYGNDTGFNGGTKQTGVLLRISTNPDFFLTADPEHNVISPGTSSGYSISMETINNFSNNVTLTATADRNPSSFNFSFSPAYINSTSSISNFTVTTNTNTPVGLYNLSINGTGGSLTRYSNVTIRVKDPIAIDIISPSFDEIVSGVYTFKVRAGIPTETKSVRITLGGRMGGAGALNMYYNSASNYWERTVNTFTYADGHCWFNITAEDFGSGMTISGPHNFTLSNSAPNPIINTPIDRSYVSGTSVPISVNTTSYVISCRFRIDQNAWTPLTRSVNTWTGSYDTTQITDGAHTLTIEAKDSAGLTGDTSVTIFVDNNNPTCTMNSPINDQYIEGTYTFRVVATDTVGVHHVDINIFGSDITLPYNPITSSYEYTLTTSTQPDGEYQVYATAYDNVNLSTNSDTITFYIDNNDPSLDIVRPMDDEIIGGVYNVQATSSDTFLNRVEYMIDSTGWQTMTGTEPNWNLALNTTLLTDGDHTITVRSFDNSSHKTEQSVDFVVDNTNPTCNVIAPFEGAFLESVFTFKISSTDAVGIDNVMVTVFGGTYQASYNLQTGYYEYSFNTLTLTDGDYNISASSKDLSGKITNSSMINFKVDNEAPQITLHGLQTGDYVSGSFLFNVSVTDPFLRDVRYSVDDGEWVPINQTWDTTLLLDGEHTVRIQARDQAGHSTTQTLDLIVDNNLPVCAVNAPVGSEFIEGAYTFKLSAYDSVAIDRVEIQVFGSNFSTTYSMSSGYYEFTTDTSIRPDNNYSCYAIVYDSSGKMNTSAVVDFQIDNNAPILRIFDPREGDFLEGNVTMNASATDAFLDIVEYNVDGSGWISAGNVLDTTLFGDGTHTISFRAKDLAGHITTATISVKIDNNNPTGSITSPAEGQFLEGTGLFTALASDQVGVDKVMITIFGSTLDMSFNTISGSYEYRTDTRLIPDGNYSFNITIRDVSGKLIEIGPRNFQIDNNAPSLAVIYPSAWAYLEGLEQIEVNASDVFLDLVQYNIDDTGWVPVNTTLNTTRISDGTHSIVIRATDLAGHYTSSTVNVIIDNTAPYGAINSPAELQFIGGAYLFQAVASDIVGIESVKIELFNNTLDMNYNSGTGYYEFRTDTSLIADGNYTIMVYITDLSGKITVVGPRTFQIDNHYPELEVYNIHNDDILSDSVLLDYFANDTFLEAVEYEIDNTGWTDISIPFNTTQVLDGDHTIRIRAVDGSEKETMLSFSIRVDNIFPTCTINSPVEGEFVEGTIFIRVSAFDIVGIDYVLIKVYELEVRVPFNAQTGYYEYTSNTVTWGTGEDGVRNVTATVYDLTGKSFSYGPVNFNVDNRPPTININSPREGEIVSGLFFFDVENGDVFKKGTEYNIDGASWQPVSIAWNTKLVNDGLHEVTIRATDLAGHITLETIYVYVDNNAPEITLASPTDNEFVEGTYVFRVSASDEVGLTKVLMRIGQETKTMSYNTQSGYYEYMLDTSTLMDGTYSMNATAIDVAGREVTTTNLQFRVDNNDPELTVESPVKDELISGLFVIRARTNDEFPGVVRYAIDGTTWFDVTTPWNSTMVNDGPHTITVKTEDQAGHETIFDINVLVDNTAPVISQTSLTPGEALSGVKTIRFYAYDAIGISGVMLRIDDAAPFEIYRGEGGLYYEFLLDTRILADGDHTITVTAYDRAENHDSSTYGITLDNSGPEIALDYYWMEGDDEVRIGNVKEGKSVIFKATVTDPSGVTHVMINIDSLGWREMAPDSNSSNPDTYVLYWPTTDADGGAHVFQIRTADKLGNEATRSGLISVKEKDEKTSFMKSFTNALPVIWLIIFLLLIIAIGILAYLGVLTKWARGEGRTRREKTPVEGDEKKLPKESKPSKKRFNPFKSKSKDENVEEWEQEDAK